MGRTHLSRMYIFPIVFFLGAHFFYLGKLGEKEIRDTSLPPRKLVLSRKWVYLLKSCRCPLEGSGSAAAIALWAACSRLQIKDSKQNKAG